MSASEESRHAARGRRWPTIEKRRIVELSLREGASISEIALTHGIHATSLSHWRSLYRAGKLTGESPRKHTCATSAKFLPVTITAERDHIARSPRALARSSVTTPMRESSTVYLSLPSGATVRFEVGVLDAAFVRALLAELRT